MRKRILLLLLMMAISASVGAAHFGVGGYGGVNIPIIQEDQSSGTVYGLKAKLSLLPGIALEPNINFAKFGDAEYSFGVRKGSKVTSYGVDAILGSAGLGAIGFRMYGILGGGIYKIKRDNDDDISKMGWTTGLGFEIGLAPSFGLDFRGKLNIVTTDGGGSKKSAAVTGGLNYYFGF
ncbi:MAG: outer membrane beta-barrel protein [candidate division Zixibacteria bacterium]|nr:outer membrane beta-barrel protein [candidate division Zixibacteria bacterium]